MPLAQIVSATPSEKSARMLKYERKGQAWEAFKCPCGKAIQLSPAFNAPSVRCRGCKRQIEIVGKSDTTEVRT